MNKQTKPQSTIKIDKRERVYKINYSSPGLVVVFNYMTFKKFDVEDREFTRHGSEKDVKRIKEVFGTKLKFQVKVHLDFTREQTDDAIDKYAKEEYQGDVCFICFILSHGFKEGFRSSDFQEIYFADIEKPIKLNKSLINKPKMFFIQACRGIYYMPNPNQSQTGNTGAFASQPCDTNGNPLVRLPVAAETDFFKFSATVEGYIAVNHYEGSPFIQILCTVIDKEPGLEIESIKKKVTQIIAELPIEMNLPGETESSKVGVVPQSNNATLTKQFYFKVY